MSIDTSKPWPRPTPAQVWAAIDIYIRCVYGTDIPSAIRARLETLKCLQDPDFYDSPVFEHDNVAYPPRYRIRLGNPFYPHMKMVIDRSIDGKGHVFRADPHDDHCAPMPGSREYTELLNLINRNKVIAEKIENLWAKRGIPTVKLAPKVKKA